MQKYRGTGNGFKANVYKPNKFYKTEQRQITEQRFYNKNIVTERALKL